MRRADQFVLIGSAVPLAWLAMMAVHEAGHVTGALLTGGTVKVVVIHPLAVSCTVLFRHTHPLLVSVSGPVLCVLIPLAAFGVAAALRNYPRTNVSPYLATAKTRFSDSF